MEERNNILPWLSLGNTAFNSSKHLLVIFKNLPGSPYEGKDICKNAIEFYLKAYLTFKGFDFEKEKDVFSLYESSLKYDPDFKPFSSTDFNLDGISADTKNRELIVSAIEKYLQAAEQIRALVLSKVGISQQEVENF